ncbi:MAG: catalase [Proteobacteria bacterium]|nr:catalase [Pseudomonadota bacterium]
MSTGATRKSSTKTRSPSTSKNTNSSKTSKTKVARGKGDELHQLAGGNIAPLTTQQGIPVSDDQNSLKAGPRGPVLLEDFAFREKIFHFDHERIPERVVHARGYGAHGYFQLTKSLAHVTRANIFQRVGEKTEAFVRFSTVAGSKGSFDLARDVRGFAVKLYTKEGNWDLVGNNIPVFFIQDAIKFPDVIHAVKPEPDREFPQAQSAHDNFWDFISLTPESMHMIMWIMSDRAIPRSFRFMEGFGVHTFRFVDAKGKSTFVKFHWKPKLGLQSVAWNEAVKINGADPDFHRRDLWDAISSGNFPEWDLGVQLFDQKFADDFEFDVLDPTKIIPEEVLPVQIVGRLVLDRLVDNFFAHTEQVAFCTQNVPPGIDFSNDPLLQGRNFSYLDTQLKRLGSPNFTYLPVNAPRCPFANFQQDGHMATRNPTGRANYEPNSWGVAGGPREHPDNGFKSFAASDEGEKQRTRPESFADHYSQARMFYRSQTPIEQKHIADALVFELSKVEHLHIRKRMVSHLPNIDSTLAAQVAKGLGIDVPEQAEALIPPMDVPTSEALSIILRGPKSFKGRKLGIFASDGADARLVASLISTFEKEGATCEIVAPKIAGVILSDGRQLVAKQKIDGGPSVLYDAVALIFSEEQANVLAKDAVSKDFLRDAFAHCKFVAYSPRVQSFIAAAGLSDELDEGCFEISSSQTVSSFLKACRELRYWRREPSVDFDAQ